MRENTKVLFLNHDVNNQLGIALGYFELLLDKVSGLKNDPHASYILKSLLRTRDLSSELALACMDDGDSRSMAENDLTVVSVQNQLLKNAIPSYQKMMGNCGIKVSIKTTVIDEEKFCYGIRPSTLERVRENIISNAINAGATELDIHLEMKEYCVVFNFKDNGKGMTQEELDKVILAQHGDGKIHGIGTRCIVEAAKEHGCAITYASGIGTGTTIRVLAPYCLQQT